MYRPFSRLHASLAIMSYPTGRLTSAFRLILPLLVIVSVQIAQAAFNPPVIVRVVPSGGERIYFIDRGMDANIKIGDVLDVFRQIQRRTSSGEVKSQRIQMGTMEITASEAGVSLGRFIQDPAIKGNLLIRMKLPVKGDLVLPELKIDSSVLFDAGAATLQLQVVSEELDKIVEFVRAFSPSKLTIEGHTDSDGDEGANQALSVQRAEMVASFLVSNYEEITQDMVNSKGYGETRPIVPNNTTENRALNRRIEIVVLE